MNCRICGATLPDGAMFCGECGSSTSATPESRRPADPRPGDTYVIERSERGVLSVPLDAPAPEADGDSVPAESPPPAVGPAPAGDEPGDAPRFVLAFTTGEVVTVHGTGLVGRRPLAEPGEAFDHLVQIVDRGLSVSKTHLEFGEHDGGLWIADRFSANGTVVRRPGESGTRCEPGRRVLVPRGSRVEIGEQAFTVD
ncbi:FHA domain-containing protein [Agromyces sp. SYSU T0242]|uniref:FHA domain-containing protein n=1 Tax=Agromyces litoreus TaxID=3158561 RepID=UPI00339287B6